MIRDHRLRDLLSLAEQSARAGRRGRAVAFYRKVLLLTQDGEFERELAHARLANLHLALGQARHALPHLNRAIALSGGEPEYALMLGVALSRLDRATEAIPLLHDAATAHWLRSEALDALALALEASGDRAGAAALARHAAGLYPERPEHRLRAREFADA